ncbi:MAG: hypothetical protein KBT09_00695 [Bacteroidales bacterium]|nr:hypothetical protein [Candidatus Sodaliphilus fimicaballi]
MKRNLLFIIITALCMLTSRAGVITHSETFSPSNWSFLADTVDSTPYTHVTYDGLDYISEPGKPLLPVKYVQLMVPYNAINITVSCSYNLRRTRVLDAKILPVEVPQIADETASATPVIAEDSTIYGVNALFPAVRAEVVSDDYFMGDNHVITVALYPMQYNPIAGQVTYYSGLSASVSYDIGTAPANLLHRNNEKARNEDLTQLATIVQNPSQIQAFKAPARVNNTQGNTNQSSLVESYEYTIITTKELQPAFKRLITLKRQKGYSAGTVCIEDIMQNPNVNGGDSIFNESNNLVSVIADSAGVIRQYLKRAFENGTRYVLMGGRKVPYRYAYRTYNTKTGTHLAQIPTDWYYSELKTNWNSSQIGNYVAEVNMPIKSYSASLYIGRLMADSIADINNYCRKLFQYELNPGNGNSTYLNNALVVEGARDFDTKHLAVKKYRQIGMITSEINQNESTYYPSGKLVIDTLKYHGIISIHGHGSPHRTTVNHFEQDNHSATNHVICALDSCEANDSHNKVIEIGNGLECMDNKYSPSIFYSWACTTTPFDIYTEPGVKTYFGWNMGQSYALGKDYGGVAYLGCTRVGFTSYFNHEVNFIEALGSILNIGRAEAQTKLLAKNSFFAMTHNLIGDPEFQVWTQSPQNNNEVIITRTDNAIQVSGINGDNTTVAYCDNTTQDIVNAYNGEAIITSGNPNSSIIVCAQNHLVYIAPLIMQNYTINQSQHVLATDVTVGSQVDSNRSNGEVVIKAGANYDIQCSGKIELKGGFHVEKGASLTIYKPQSLTL